MTLLGIIASQNYSRNFDVEYLVIAGGGPAAQGGGGGGGYKTASLTALTPIVIGDTTPLIALIRAADCCACEAFAQSQAAQARLVATTAVDFS